MSSSRMKQGGDEATYDETMEATFDPVDQGEGEEEVVSYLMPRLAAYASRSASSLLESDGDEQDSVKNEGDSTHEANEKAEEDRTGHVLAARDSGERSAAHVTDDGTAEESRERMNSEDSSSVEKTEGAAAVQADEQDVACADSGVDDDVHEEEEDDTYKVDSDAAEGRATASHYATAFAHSRVKELLKYEGSSSIVSKDAAAAACEAVALLTRDLVATAAAEATRRNRRTLTYDDVARVAQLLDRFSFLADVVPPAPSSSSGASFGAGKSIVVGSHLQSSSAAGGGGGGNSSRGGPRKRNVEASARSKSAQGRGQGPTASAVGSEVNAAARAKTTHARVMHSVASPQVHPQPGGMRQATLRF